MINRINKPWYERISRNAEGGATGAAPGATGAADGAAGTAAGAPANTQTLGDVANTNQEASSASASVSLHDAPVLSDFQKSLGDMGKDPALKDFKDAAGLAKAFKDTKEALGKNAGKVAIPGENSTQEEKDAFYKAIGVPATPEDYKFGVPDNMPEPLKAKYSEEHAGKWAKIFKDHNVPAETANALRNAFMEEVGGDYAKLSADITKSDAEFEKLSQKIFGDNSDKALTEGKTLFEKYMPPELKAELKDMPNSALLAMAAVANQLHKEAFGEDRIVNGESNSSAQSPAALTEEMQNIMRSPEYRDPFSKGKDAHDRAGARVREISKTLADIQSKK